MKRIYKQSIPVQEIGVTINVPPSARVVHFQKQDGLLNFWYEFDDEEEGNVNLTFKIVGTGHPYSRNGKHRGTCQDGPYIWHLIEVPSP